MADVVINIKGDLSQLSESVTKLSRDLRDAKLELKDLDKSSAEYAAKKKQIDDMTRSYNSQKDALKDLSVQTKEQEKAFKEQEKAAKKTAEAFAESKSKMGDLKDEAILLQGTGIEKLKNSFNLLKDGLETGNLDKTKLAFKGLGSAMSAIPILLLVEGFKLLVENFDTAKDIFKTIFGLFSEGEQNVKRLTKELKNQKEANELATNALSNEIKVLEVSGKNQARLVQAKKELNALKIKELQIDAELQKARIQEIIDNDSLTEAYYRKAASVLTALNQDKKAAEILKLIDINKRERAEEALKKYKEDQVAIANLKTEQIVEDIKNDKQAASEAIKIAEDKKKRLIELEKELSEALIAGAQQQKEINKQILDDIEKEKQAKINAQAAVDQAEYDSMVKKKEADAKLKADKEKARQEDIAAVNEGLAIESAAIQSIQGSLDTLFAIKSANAKAGSAEEEANAKKQFQLNKGLQLAAAAMNGAQAITAILSVPDFTFGVLSAFRIAAAIGTTAATIAKISATQFKPSGGGGGGGSVSAPSGGAGGIRNVPAPNQPAPTRPQDSTQFNEDGTKKDKTVKVVVLQKDIKASIDSVARVDQQARF